MHHSIGGPNPHVAEPSLGPEKKTTHQHHVFMDDSDPSPHQLCPRNENKLQQASGYQAKHHNFIAVFQYLGLTASASCDHGSVFINTSSLICFILTNPLSPLNDSGK